MWWETLLCNRNCKERSCGPRRVAGSERERRCGREHHRRKVMVGERELVIGYDSELIVVHCSMTLVVISARKLWSRRWILSLCVCIVQVQHLCSRHNGTWRGGTLKNHPGHARSRGSYKIIMHTMWLRVLSTTELKRTTGSGFISNIFEYMVLWIRCLMYILAILLLRNAMTFSIMLTSLHLRLYGG